MAPLATSDFIERRLKIKSYEEKEALLKDAVDTENEYRGLFARHRESWEVPEVADPLLGLVDVFAQPEAFRCFPRYAEDSAPRCFELGDKRLPGGELSVIESLHEFEQSWDCFAESQLRFLNWKNVFAAGGAVAACLTPLPAVVRKGSWAEGRVKRRHYFHDEAYPGSDVDLFLYGLDKAQAEEKLVEIFEAVQAANPYQVVCFRSANAITLISQYPFRHIQIVLRLYNSPAEVLMGFDVDSCACGYDGSRAYTCQRTVIAFAMQANTVDMTRRSASYEMRLSKYAERGFEVVVPQLVRERVDPSLYERRFDQVQGLARMLVLERLRTPEARFRYKIEQKLKRAARREQYKLRRQLNKVLRDKHELARVEDNTVALEGVAGAELSNYSTVFLPWGPAWTAQKVVRVMRQKDHAINQVEFRPGGRVVKNTRKYRIHVCATGSMAEVIQDPWPKDPPIPDDVPRESLTQLVYGPVSWLVDNPGRQQIGSFHPITDGDWMEGAYLSAATEELAARCAADDGEAVAELLAGEGGAEQLSNRDYLGRSALHVAVLCGAQRACEALLARPEAGAEVLFAKLADGRTALHLAALRGLDGMLEQLLAKRRRLLEEAQGQETAAEQLDIDGADWELKLSPLQYTIVFGHELAMAALLREGASAKKLAVHKDLNLSRSALALCATFACESRNLAIAEGILKKLLSAGASTTQVDMASRTVYHDLVGKSSDAHILEMFLQADDRKTQSIDVVAANGCTALAEAVNMDNLPAVKLFLAHGASAQLSPDEHALRKKRAMEGSGQKSSMRLFAHQQDDMQRCPVLLAAENLRVDILRALLEHDPALVATTMKRGMGMGAQVQTALDLVEAKRTGLDQGREQRQKHLNVLTKAVERATEALASQAKGSYGQEEWALELWKQRLSLDELKLQQNDTEENEEGEGQARERIEAAAELIKACGGKPHPPEEGSEKSQPLHMSHLFHRGGLFNNQQKEVDPLTSHIELNQHRHHQAKRLMGGEQPAAQQLFEAVFTGDSAAVSAAGEQVHVSIASSHGRTPLWYAVARGNVECMRAIFQLAERQFRPKKPRGPAEAVDPNDISAQLKRINNLDLASGQGVPKDAGPTPDEMRQKLESLQQGITHVGQDSGEAKASAATPVPAHSLLLERCPVIADDEGPLAELLRRLGHIAHRGVQIDDEGESTQKEVQQRKRKLVSLTPVELALIQGDLPMLEALLALAEGKPSNAGKEGGAKETTEGEGHGKDAKAEGDGTGAKEAEDDDDNDQAEGGCKEGGEEEEEEEDEEDEDGETGQAEEEQKEVPPDARRFQILHTNNNALGNLSMLQIAVVMDNPDAFLMVVAFAKECALSEPAVQAWQREVEGKADKEEADKRLSHHMFGHQSASLLQFALWAGSRQVVRLLLSGAADAALVGWLDPATSATSAAPAASQAVGGAMKKGRRSHVFGGGEDKFVAMKKWLIKHVHASGTQRPELIRRLFGPEVADAQGRTALFYAIPETLPDLLAGGAGQVDLQHRARTAAAKKQNQGAGGHTALLAAAASGAAELAVQLADAGCDVSAAAGKRSWNCLHFAVSGNPAMPVTIETKYARARHVAEELLARVPTEVAATLLFAPDAEHTPLMLAVQQGAEPLVRFLAERMVAVGEAGKVALGRRDKNHSSSMHMAAAADPPQSGVVRALLEAREVSGEASSSLGPNVENAAGATPLELLMEKVAEVWAKQANTGHGGLFGHNVIRMKPHNTKKKKGDAQKEEEEHPRRRCYELLNSAVDQTKPGQRLTASFDDVQLAARHATAEAGKGGTDEDVMAANMSINLMPHYGGMFGGGGGCFPQFRD